MNQQVELMDNSIDCTAEKRAGTLGIVNVSPVSYIDGKIYANVSFGRTIEALAARYEKVILCVPTSWGIVDVDADYLVKAQNIELCPQPYYLTSLEALSNPALMLSAYNKLLKNSDFVFVRGMIPFVSIFYFLAWRLGIKPVHEIIGNPIALLRSHTRAGRLKDFLGLIYAYQDRWFTRLGRWLTGGAFLCNGSELVEIFTSPRTVPILSSTILKSELFVRKDTCQDGVIKLLYVGYIRPEKGLEYLISALPKLSNAARCLLTIVGPWAGYREYKAKLDELVESLGISEKVEWSGFVSYGPEMWKYLRTYDIFILPSLSEGAPRVFLEARANSLPIVSTNVGGIPLSVQHGFDGILVPPKDSAAISGAIDLIIEDGMLRQKLIDNGFNKAKHNTLEEYIETIKRALEE